MLRRRASTVRAEEQATTATAARSVDFAATLCPEDQCSTLRDGVWRWRDGDHISVEESRLLAGEFHALFER